MKEFEVEKVWITDDAVHISLVDGREYCEYFKNYERLKSATPEQLANFTTDQWGIRWEVLDEDLSFEGFVTEKLTTPLYDFFKAHPELNASAVARRMGISQSLFAQYVSGVKKPSAERVSDVIAAIRSIGLELQSATL